MKTQIVLTGITKMKAIQTVCRTLLPIVTIALFSNCSSISEISIEEAREIELRFRKESLSKPPRSLGPLLRIYEKNYIVNWKQTASCSEPQEHLTDNEIEEVIKSFATDWEFAAIDLAQDEYFNGNMNLALDILKYVDEHGSHTPLSIAQSDMAKYLAEMGDLAKAETYLKKGLGSLGRSLGSSAASAADAKFHYFSAKGALQFANGDLADSIITYNRAISVLSNNKSRFFWQGVWRMGEAQLGIARSLLWQGRLLEAEIWARKTIEMLNLGGTVSLTREGRYLPFAFVMLSKILFEQQRYDDAERLGQIAISMLLDVCTPIDSIVLAQARESLAQTKLATKKWPEALAQFQTIEKEMETNRDVFNTRFKGNSFWGFSLIKNNQPQKAINQLNYAQTRAKELYGNNHVVTGEILGFKALALLRLNRRSEAKQEFDVAIPIMLKKWNEYDGRSSVQRARTFRFSRILEGYIDLLTSGKNRHQDQLIKALDLAETLRVQSVARSILSSTQRFKSQNQQLSELVRKKQDTEKRIAVLRSQLLNIYMTPNFESLREEEKKLKFNIKQLETALKTFISELSFQFPNYESIESLPSISAVDAQRVLAPNETYISFFSGEDAIHTWAFRSKGPILHKKINLTRTELAKKIKAIRSTIDPKEVSRLNDIPDFNFLESYRIFTLLLSPFDSYLKESEQIVLSRNGPLGQLPFSALTTKQFKARQDKKLRFSSYRKAPWLIRSHAIGYVPSLSSFVALRESKITMANRKPFIGFGDPIFNHRKKNSSKLGQEPVQLIAQTEIKSRAKVETRGFDLVPTTMLPRLPETASELEKLAIALGANPQTDVLLGKNATELKVKEAPLTNKKVIAFATHGLVPGDLDGLNEPALAMTSPVNVSTENDGLLTMGEIMGLKLNADWVILSACNTAAGEGKGADALSGLGQAFFYSGAKTILATSWSVESTSAIALTNGLYSKQDRNKNISKSQRLQQSKLQMINNLGLTGTNSGRMIAAFSHPYFWAPFILVGESGHE